MIYTGKKTTSERRPDDVQATSTHSLGKAIPHMMAEQHETPTKGRNGYSKHQLNATTKS